METMSTNVNVMAGAVGADYPALQGDLLPFDAANIIKKMTALNQSLNANIAKLKDLMTEYSSSTVLQKSQPVQQSAEKLIKTVEVYENVLNTNSKLIDSLQKLSTKPAAAPPVKHPDVTPIITESPVTSPPTTPITTPSRSSVVADRKRMFENEHKQPITPPPQAGTGTSKKRGGSSGGSFTIAPVQNAAIAELTNEREVTPRESGTVITQTLEDRKRGLQESKNAEKDKIANSKQDKFAAMASELSSVHVKEAAATADIILPGSDPVGPQTNTNEDERIFTEPTADVSTAVEEGTAEAIQSAEPTASSPKVILVF
jgi:hypothetical protein